MSEASESAAHGVAGYLGDLLNWGIAKKKPKSIQEADALALKLSNRWTALTAGVSWVPGSTFILMGMDYKLYHDISRIYGVKSFNVDAVTTAITTTIVGRGTAELLSFVPGVGWVVKAGIAAGATRLLCEVLMDYFRGQSSLK